ncbi:catalase family protein [Swaminathania salitolerans]|uniref:Catalase n=1 Tax=Swaminathania salitolerans TaxID=182838 RepID=A0A511BLB4_9PROT|nr:catalase family protein [Swaminathania salitolerans]GBQ10009.1 catalase [Swaminathania salitolerans LMG 21291]GEL01131.1 catalase [Swaminathania salitolerans]
MLPPVLYDPGLEMPAADEEGVIRDILTQFHRIVSATHRDLGHAERGVHAKSHALLEGSLHVHRDLSAELAQGLFATPGTYPLVARLSAIPGDPLRDAVSGPRGLALKIDGVEGELLETAGGNAVQDFLFANGTAFGAPTAYQFLQSLRLLALTTDRAEGAKAALSRLLRRVQRVLARFGHRSAMLDALGGFLPTHPLGDRFHSQVPLRHGRHVAKYDIVPDSENFRRLSGATIDIDRDPFAIRNAISRVMAAEGGRWSLRVQLCRDVEAQPIENGAVEWSEAISPFQNVATIELPPQTSWSRERARSLEDALCFSPWQGLEAHRPLGNIMRARRAAYPFSSGLRGRLNGCPVHGLFPKTIHKNGRSDQAQRSEQAHDADSEAAG